MRRVKMPATPFQSIVSDRVIDSRLKDAEPMGLREGFGQALDSMYDLWEDILDKRDKKIILDRAAQVGAMVQRLVEDNNLTGEKK